MTFNFRPLLALVGGKGMVANKVQALSMGVRQGGSASSFFSSQPAALLTARGWTPPPSGVVRKGPALHPIRHIPCPRRPPLRPRVRVARRASPSLPSPRGRVPCGTNDVSGRLRLFWAPLVGGSLRASLGVSGVGAVNLPPLQSCRPLSETSLHHFSSPSRIANTPQPSTGGTPLHSDR